MESFPLLYSAIYLFHMPLFFFLSGALTTKPIDKPTLSKKFSSLGKPYLVGFLFTLPLQISKPDHPSNTDPVIGFLWGSGNHLYNSPIWFLVSLFSAFYLLYLIDRLHLKTWARNSLAMGMFMLSIYLMETGIGFSNLPMDKLQRPLGAPLNIDLAPLTVAFLIAGQSLRPYFLNRAAPKMRVLTGIIVFSVIFIGAFQLFSPRMDLNYRRIQSSIGTSLCIIAGIAFTTLISSLTCQLKLKTITNTLGLVGKNSLIILIFHATTQGFLLKTLENKHLLNTISGLAVTVASIILLTTLSVQIINRSPILRRIVYT